MIINDFKPGVILKLPLGLRFNTIKQNANECSVEASPLAVTFVKGGKSTAKLINFVPYAPAGINYVETDGDVLSSHFSGCILSTYTVNSKRRVAHVHTGEDAGAGLCCKEPMKKLLNSTSYTSIKNFQPYCDADLGIAMKIIQDSAFGIQGLVTFGLVTSMNHEFSIFTRKLSSHEFLIVEVVDQKNRPYKFA
jgi:hypothetical protein